MRHIWICLIDGCLVRSGSVQPADTMPVLLERMLRVFPHMAPESLKVICEDGRVFDSELWFSNPTLGDPQLAEKDDLLAAVGVVDGHVGVKLHRGLTPEEVLQREISSFSGKIDDNMDFGIFDFSGEQLGSIEDMIVLLGPQSVALPPVVATDAEAGRPRRARRTPFRRRGRDNGRGGQKPDGHSAGASPPSSQPPGAAPAGDSPPAPRPEPPPPPPPSRPAEGQGTADT